MYNPPAIFQMHDHFIVGRTKRRVSGETSVLDFINHLLWMLNPYSYCKRLLLNTYAAAQHTRKRIARYARQPAQHYRKRVLLTLPSRV